MHQIAESELIINNRGAIYHLDVRPEELAETVILVGDPDRVPMVSKHFDRVEFNLHHREFNTHTGWIGQKRISVLSTGIGPDNIDIALNELDALANIDFATRTEKSQKQRLNLIRLGTSGSLQADIPVDGFVAGSHGLGLDNVLNYYAYDRTENQAAIEKAFQVHTGLPASTTIPYVFEGSSELFAHFKSEYYHGITVTCPGFYGPQGRILRLPLRHAGLIEKLSSFHFGSLKISNFEMETSTIYGLGALLGHKCLSLNAIVANRVRKEFSKNSQAAVEGLIRKSLEIIAKI